jgi:hypothetical protein
MIIKFLKTDTQIECTPQEFYIFQEAGAIMEIIQAEEVKKPDVMIKKEKEPKENS